jgi:hypothetical protein
MLQNSRNAINDGEGNSGRSTNDNVRQEIRKRFEGFEGMNYEQRRGPYNPHSGSQGPECTDKVDNSRNRRDDL